MSTHFRPIVSVVICTRNRADDLVRTLDSLVRQRPESPSFEVIVVDNASTDGTSHIVARFEDQVTLRRVSETTPGLCHARNAGWRAARGSYIAFLDDDTIACEGWVTSIVDAFTARPDAGAVGGRVVPVWLAPRPSWLSDRVTLALTIVDWSPVPKVLTDLRTEWLVGANMAVRIDLLRDIGGFRPELDRVGTRLLSSGDIFLLKEIVARGATCFYYPAMTIRHLVPRARLTKRWFRRRYYWQGVSDAVMDLLERTPSSSERLGLARRALWRLLAQAWRRATPSPTGDPNRFARTCWMLVAAGRVVGLLGTARAPMPGRRRPQP